MEAVSRGGLHAYVPYMPRRRFFIRKLTEPDGLSQFTLTSRRLFFTLHDYERLDLHGLCGISHVRGPCGVEVDMEYGSVASVRVLPSRRGDHDVESHAVSDRCGG